MMIYMVKWPDHSGELQTVHFAEYSLAADYREHLIVGACKYLPSEVTLQSLVVFESQLDAVTQTLKYAREQ